MASTLSPPTQAEFLADQWPTGPSFDAKLRAVDLDLNKGRLSRKRPPLRKRAARALARFLFTFCIGIAATLAWQSYGDAAREIIANSSPQLGWLAPQALPLAQTTRSMAAPATSSLDSQQLNAMTLGLAAVRNSVDQLAAQCVAVQQQMTGDIARLHAAEQDIMQRISAPVPRPAAAPARKPVPVTLSPSSNAPPVR